MWSHRIIYWKWLIASYRERKNQSFFPSTIRNYSWNVRRSKKQQINTFLYPCTVCFVDHKLRKLLSHRIIYWKWLIVSYREEKTNLFSHPLLAIILETFGGTKSNRLIPFLYPCTVCFVDPKLRKLLSHRIIYWKWLIASYHERKNQPFFPSTISNYSWNVWRSKNQQIKTLKFLWKEKGSKSRQMTLSRNISPWRKKNIDNARHDYNDSQRQ
jgi:hypothetical protein